MVDQTEYLNFNPLHHEGGDYSPCTRLAQCRISIHSTTRVETIEATYNTQPTVISIHSTTRVETIEDAKTEEMEVISIHSTTRVETRACNIWR